MSQDGFILFKPFTFGSEKVLFKIFGFRLLEVCIVVMLDIVGTDYLKPVLELWMIKVVGTM
jgi:hypothetical protein